MDTHLAATVADNGEAVGLNNTHLEPISPDGTPEPGKRYEVPARHGRAVRLARGQVIRIVNTHGSQVCDTWAFKSDDLSEFMSMEHARAAIDRIIP
ncbi:urea carboxylase-associated family protein, partial [Bordetella hinzii]|nr:urea carboxylase-associated family protein [Bordetella hinzii]